MTAQNHPRRSEYKYCRELQPFFGVEMLSFQEYLSEARITMDKYVEGDEFTTRLRN